MEGRIFSNEIDAMLSLLLSTGRFAARVASCLLVALAVGAGVADSAVALPAFLGAVGQGATSTGGRGGDVYHVTTLMDYDSGQPSIVGSLRHAIASATGPRTIVFDVGGGIQLARPLSINRDQLTIAGQTSPSGVTLWGYPATVSGAEDVVVRFLRFRTGDFNAQNANPDGSPAMPASGNGNMDLLADNADAISVTNNSDRVILDHVSAGWGMDETVSVTVSKNVTVQHSIIAQSLNDSFHYKGEHGYGSLVRGELTDAEQAAGVGGYTFFGNLWAHHKNRNPSFGGQQNLEPGQSEADRRALDVNLVNNVIYDKGSNFAHRNTDGEVRTNIIGNYFINGPESPTGPVFNENANGVTHVYQEGNFVDPFSNLVHDGVAIVTPTQIANFFKGFESDDSLTNPGEGSPFNFFDSVQAHVASAETAYTNIVDSVGAALWRDAIDDRLITELTSRSGSIIDSQDELRVGGVLLGIEDLTSTFRPAGFDTDGDGIPNDFEMTYGLDPGDPADGNMSNLSPFGYTNLEFYLDSLVSDFFDLPPPNADFDGDQDVDGDDFLTWQRNFGTGSDHSAGDSDSDGDVDRFDLANWEAQFGSQSPLAASVAVPEPASSVLSLIVALALAGRALSAAMRQGALAITRS